MILTFESFKNSFSKVSEQRHLEVLEAAAEVVNSIGTQDEGNACLNFLTLFAQTYGTECENWMDLDKSIELAKLYVSDEFDFTTISVTAEHGPVPYFDQEDYKKIEIKEKELEKEGWKSFIRHEDAKTQTDDTFDYKERFFDIIFCRAKILSVKKLNKVNQKTGLFESWKKSQKVYNRDDVKFKDLHENFKKDFEKKFNLEVVEKLKETGFDVEVTYNNGDSACSLLVNTIPMHIVNRYELTFENETLYGPSFKNQVVFEILRNAGVDAFIGGPKFTSASAVRLFFDKMELDLYINPKLKKAVDVGVFDKD